MIKFKLTDQIEYGSHRAAMKFILENVGKLSPDGIEAIADNIRRRLE